MLGQKKKTPRVSSYVTEASCLSSDEGEGSFTSKQVYPGISFNVYLTWYIVILHKDIVLQ